MDTEQRRPFVPPTLTEEASLLDVTLWSGRRRRRRHHWDWDDDDWDDDD